MESNKINTENSELINFDEKVEPLDKKEILFFGLSFGFIALSTLVGIYIIVELVFAKLF